MKNICYLFVLIAGVACQPKNNEGTEIDLPFYNDETWSAVWLEEDDTEYSSIHQISDFKFVNQNGDTITNETFDGKVYVANFFFTACPTVCPKMETNLSLVQTEFESEDRVKILSHTVMPWADSVSQLKKYAELNEINSNQWHLSLSYYG